MASCLRCTLCNTPGTFEDAADKGQVPCNVREFQDKQFTLWRCKGCGTLHCAEDADLSLFYANYPLKSQKVTFNEKIGYGNRLKMLERLGFQRSQCILDYGCGAGLYVDFLKSSGCTNVSGYDAFVPKYEDPVTLNRTYDAVVSHDVIEHDEDPCDFLVRVTRLVRPGGLLVIGTPRADAVDIRRIGDPQLHVPYHRHILSEQVLLALGQRAGLKPVDVYRRSFYDSFYPTVNSRFMWRYIRKSGGLLNAAVEPPNTGVVVKSPAMLFLAFFGYFFPRGDNMIVTFRQA